MMPFDAYKQYLSIRNHFTKESYDYHKYCGKSRASVQSFYKRKDRFWFEKLARNKDDKEVIDFFVANFISADNPETVWIGGLVREGETYYKDWQKRVQSLTYIVKEETESLFAEHTLDQVFNCSAGHPVLLKRHLAGDVSIETMVIYDRIFGYIKNFDKKLDDPVWKTVSLKLKKYGPFLNINELRFKSLIKKIVIGE